MSDKFANLGLSALLCCVSAAWAQDTPPPPPANPTAQSEAGEPRVNTSEPRADASEPAPDAARPAPAAKTSANKGASAGTAPAGTAPAGTAPAKPANPKAANAADKLQLGTATVTGDREQPKVMYVVPWKRPDIGDAEGKPMNSLVDEILSPVDRDVFRREVRYYETVKSEAAQNGAAPAAQQVEK